MVENAVRQSFYRNSPKMHDVCSEKSRKPFRKASPAHAVRVPLEPADPCKETAGLSRGRRKS